MKIVEATADAEVLDRSGRTCYRLARGHRYALHDGETERGCRSGALRVVGPIDAVLPPFHHDAAGELRLVLPFIGRLGDALVAASCLAALLEERPEARITVASAPDALELLDLVDLPIARRPYPLTVTELREQTHYLSLEGADLVADAPNRSLADVFSQCLGCCRPSRPARLLTPACHDSISVGDERLPHVGIQLTEAGSPRTYPVELSLELARMLVERGVVVYLLGRSEEVNAPLPDSPPMLRNFVGCTESIAALAGVVGSMDLIVGPDSLLPHLAAALGVTGLTIFTSTNPVLASDYVTASVAASMLDCSPCGKASGACPVGHLRCEAPYRPELRPARLCREVLSLLGGPCSAVQRCGQVSKVAGPRLGMRDT